MNYYFLIVSLFCLYFTACNRSSELSQTEQSSTNESEVESKDITYNLKYNDQSKT